MYFWFFQQNKLGFWIFANHPTVHGGGVSSRRARGYGVCLCVNLRGCISGSLYVVFAVVFGVVFVVVFLVVFVVVFLLSAWF